MEEMIDIEILKIASAIAYQKYSPENEGMYQKVNGDIMYYTPKNIKAIYDELVSLFKDAQKLPE